MAIRTDDLRRAAMELPETERADLAAKLLASLGDPTDDQDSVNAEWDAEILRRAEAVEAGDVATERWEVVRDRLVAKRSV